MKRVDGPGHVGNRFSDGNPALGQRATVPGASWFDAVQEEIARAIELAGIALDPDDSEQLYAAMLAIAAGAAGAGGGSVPTVRQVLAAGLATGGGDLAADRTITVAASSVPQAIAGTLNSVALTPLALAGLFGANLGSKYLVLPASPNPLIIQWGSLVGSYTEGSVSVTLPTSFTATDYAVVGMAINQSADINRDIFAQRVTKATGSFTAYLNYDGSGTNAVDGLEFIAIGR